MVKFAVTALVIYGLVVTLMYVAQRRLQYFPNTEFADASVSDVANVEQVSLKTRDGEMLVAWYKASTGGKPVIMFFHGNGGSIADRPGRLQHYTQAGFGVLFVSYRGYGGSTGSPTEEGLIADAHAAYDWLIDKGLTPDNIVLVGESLGSGVALQLASGRAVAAIALAAPYSSITDVAAGAYWWLPVRYLLKDQFESIDVIGKINVPLLITHGTADTIVPYGLGRRLFEAANHPKQFRAVEGAGHEAIFAPETWAAELRFFDALLGR